MASLSLKSIVDKMELTALTPEVDIQGIKIHQPDINRIALQMAGYFEHFEATRLQIIGYVEYSYMENLPKARQKEIYEQLLSYPTPGIVFCRELQPNDLFRKAAIRHGIPLLMTKKATSAYFAETVRWL